MPILTKSQEARYMDFCDKMRNPEAMDQVTYHDIVYPFNMNMCIQMVRDNNPFFNIYPSYRLEKIQFVHIWHLLFALILNLICALWQIPIKTTIEFSIRYTTS